jgi:predicted phosphodiesterase
MGQLEEAKFIQELRQQGKTFTDIGLELGYHPEKCRSILRRYESDLNNDISILNMLDNEIGEEYYTSRKTERRCKEIDEFERSRGYGTYFVANDFHEPYAARKLLKQVLSTPEVRKIKKAILLGDIFQMDVASKFVTDKDELIQMSLDKGSELLEVFANQFDVVYIVRGNHDQHANRELNKSIKNGLKRLIRDISPIQTIIDELEEKSNITNLTYTFGNELMLGNVVFCHPDYFSGTLGKTATGMADTYLAKYRDLSAVIVAHTHHIFSGLYRNVAVYENGCFCHEIDYHKGPQKLSNQWNKGYGIYTINSEGNLIINESKVFTID